MSGQLQLQFWVGVDLPLQSFQKAPGTWCVVSLFWTSTELYSLTWNKMKTKEKNLQCYHPCRMDLLQIYGSFVQIIYGLKNGLKVQKPEEYHKNEFYFPGKDIKTRHFCGRHSSISFQIPLSIIFCSLDLKSWSSETSSHFLIKFPIDKVEEGISVSASEVWASTKHH